MITLARMLPRWRRLPYSLLVVFAAFASGSTQAAPAAYPHSPRIEQFLDQISESCAEFEERRLVAMQKVVRRATRDAVVASAIPLTLACGFALSPALSVDTRITIAMLTVGVACSPLGWAIPLGAYFISSEVSFAKNRYGFGDVVKLPERLEATAEAILTIYGPGVAGTQLDSQPRLPLEFDPPALRPEPASFEAQQKDGLVLFALELDKLGKKRGRRNVTRGLSREDLAGLIRARIEDESQELPSPLDLAPEILDLVLKRKSP